MADSYIGEYRLPRENHHPAMSNYQTLMILLSLTEWIGLYPG
jgi:hypothetical protein